MGGSGGSNTSTAPSSRRLAVNVDSFDLDLDVGETQIQTNDNSVRSHMTWDDDASSGFEEDAAGKAVAEEVQAREMGDAADVTDFD